MTIVIVGALEMHCVAELCPTTKILFVANDDPRTPEQLACDSVSHVEE